jgi:CBS domain-containing protein
MIMAKIAAEIMDREFLYASQIDSIPKLLHEMRDRALSSLPVLDLDGRPLGTATVRDVESCHHIEELVHHLKRSAVSVGQNTSIEAAARTLAQHRAENLVLVDEHGIAVGVLSALELLRALLGFDGSARERPSGVARDGQWSDGALLELGAAHHAPAAPGVILLSSANDADGTGVVWAEAAENVRERLDAMLRLPQQDPKLEALLAIYPRSLRFRVVVVHDPEQCRRLARALASAIGRSASIGAQP